MFERITVRDKNTGHEYFEIECGIVCAYTFFSGASSTEIILFRKGLYSAQILICISISSELIINPKEILISEGNFLLICSILNKL